MDDCKDIVHNVFLNLWRKREQLDVETQLKSYLFTAVHNRCLNHIRDRKKIVRHDLPMDTLGLPEYMESTDYLQQTELEMRIKDTIDGLPDRCRQIFVLSRFDDKKYSEIADMLGISVKAVEAQMSKALRILRESLKDYLPLVLVLFELCYRVINSWCV